MITVIELEQSYYFDKFEEKLGEPVVSASFPVAVRLHPDKGSLVYSDSQFKVTVRMGGC